MTPDDLDKVLSEDPPLPLSDKLRPLVALLARQAAREWVDEQLQAQSDNRSVEVCRSEVATSVPFEDPPSMKRSRSKKTQSSTTEHLHSSAILRLPDAVIELCTAQAAVRQRYAATRVAFTLDGKLVGDIGEALAIEAFGLAPCQKRRGGVDAAAPDGRSVQVKATGDPKAGPAFTAGEGVADHLLFLRINFSSGIASVAYNGPEAPVRALLKLPIKSTQRIRLKDVLAADAMVPEARRLPRIRPS